MAEANGWPDRSTKLVADYVSGCLTDAKPEVIMKCSLRPNLGDRYNGGIGMRRAVLISALLGAMGFLFADARAAVVTVTNPSFEVGPDLGGTGGDWHAFPNPADYPASTWTASNGYTNPYVENRVGDHFPSTPDGGSYSLLLSNSGPISQDLNYNATPGQTLTLSFYTGFDGTSANPVLPAGSVQATIQIGSQTVQETYSLSSFSSQTWYSESVSGIATTGGDVSISFKAASGNPWIDAVSVNASATPEPASLAIWGVVIAGGLLVARRRKA